MSAEKTLIDKRFDEIEKEEKYERDAKTIMSNIKSILSDSDKLSKRWIWELLQNAIDLSDQVKVEFEITNDKLIYRHNGRPFKLKEARYLYKPGSNKDDESQHSTENKKPQIGQFGTGFISTHILSKVIKVKGIIDDIVESENYSFSLKLDRSERKNKPWLINSIEESEKEFKKSSKPVNSFDFTEFNTEFIYEINNTYDCLDSKKTIDEGIKNFHELIPFVFAFTPKLTEVKIKDFRSGNTFVESYKSENLQSGIEGLNLIKTKSESNDQIKDETTVATVRCNKTSIAVQVKKLSEDDQYEIQSYPDHFPILYCVFPMIGTHNFNFPVIINSEHFVPNNERDGITISNDFENRDRLKEATNAFIGLVNIIRNYKWDGVFNLYKLSIVDFKDKNLNDWYRKEIYNSIEYELNWRKIIPVSENLKDEFISLINNYLPFVDKQSNEKYELLDKLLSLSKRLYPNRIPVGSKYMKCFDIIDFRVFNNVKLDLEKLLELISNHSSNIADFKRNYNFSDNEAKDYLKDIIEYIVKNDKKHLLNDYKLIPNQKGDFCKLEKLKLDRICHESIKENDYNEKLKTIGAKLTGKDCREFLLLYDEFEEFIVNEEAEKKYELEELASTIDKEIRNNKEIFRDKGNIEILKDLFEWYNNCGLEEETLKKYFEYFSSEKAQIFLSTKSSKDLQYAFEIEISGKSAALAKLANNKLLSEKTLDKVSENQEYISNIIRWLNDEDEGKPDKELGDMGEYYLYEELKQIYGENKVKWEDKSEYDFEILEEDRTTTKYYIDAKTTAKGMANTETVPFYMRKAQWDFLKAREALNKYIIARLEKDRGDFEVRFLKINLIELG